MNQNQPSYKYLKEKLLQEISKSSPDTKLPSIKEMRSTYEVSQTTVEKAIYELEQEGLIYKVKCKGIFVADNAANLSKKSWSVALFVPRLGVSSYLSRVVDGVSETLLEKGAQLLLFGASSGKIGDKDKLFEQLRNSDFDAIIATAGGLCKDIMAELSDLALECPVVSIGPKIYDADTDWVIADDFEAAYQGVSTLIDKGHSKIALLKPDETCPAKGVLNDRFRGYKKALEDKQLEVDNELIIENEFGFQKAQVVVSRYLKKNGLDFSALFTMSDKMAIGAIMALREFGASIPEDVAVMGYGALEFEEYPGINLTSVLEPAEEMGRKAVELVFDKLENRRANNRIKEIVMPVKIKKGGTV